MKQTIVDLLASSTNPQLHRASFIPWSSPVPYFGQLTTATFGTVGLNPSNREFVDESGAELDGAYRRFETLRSLGIRSWGDAKRGHVERIQKSFELYFANNPYDLWFKRLDALLMSTLASYYQGTAVHLDLIPYATYSKWGALTGAQRDSLLRASGVTLASMVKQSPIRVLVLNGASVVGNFQRIFGLHLRQERMPKWTLRQHSDSPVKGFSYQGTYSKLADVSLGRTVLVLGYNHNIQSSFGITKVVTQEIRNWIGEMSGDHYAAA